ncbi:putative membrane-anchored protein [Arcanobacterium wilhelmae]|uniref:Membrane-anchored protein n=1 Tax=Arcanobacterium wilhelmae TaxID=1803177 RepID=A0ABT9N8B5_9ACTO|nr:putative cytokinetic ring protein SteA [Arcanobacterium wilhelmae]MDP9799933.1 putative membrane-anchored protein [Arcanobacterium wilhelmae]WFN91068.1 putative cytokinetic ring protein SteA [Arcanobacterium wilhelmae]
MVFRRKLIPLGDDSQIQGPARVDSRTKRLTKRLSRGDVAIIDHEDLDRVSAEALVECQPVVVLNAAKSTSGRYPNLGPGILLEAGLPLVDNLGSSVMDIKENAKVRVTDGGEVYVGEKLIAEGDVLTAESNALAMEHARAGMATQLKAFATNTMEYVEKEQDLILDGVGVPDVKTSFVRKHALVVVRGYRYKEDLQALRPYIREYRPVMIGVDGGADAILEAGYHLDMIVGDMDSVSDKALRCGAEIVVHAYRDGRAPGKKRMEDLGIDHVVFPATGTSEDIAMLLADDKGAELIVAVGTHSTLIEFLDKGRAGMASTFLTRLEIGSKLVDAKGVSRLYRSRISNWQIAALVIAGVIAMVAALSVTDAGQILFKLGSVWWSDFARWVTRLF